MSNTTTSTASDKNKSAASAAAPARSPENIQRLKDAGITDAQIAEMNAVAAKAAASFEDRSSDVAGYWESELSDFYGTLENVKLFDGLLNPEKPSCLVTGVAKSPCLISVGDGEGDKKTLRPAKPGEKIGIWTKPGMRDIVLCGGGVHVRIAFSGTKDVHKGMRGMNPMKVYAVTSDKPGTRIPVIEDRRKKSKDVPTIFDANGAVDDDI